MRFNGSVAAALAQRIASGLDHITAAELAERLIKDQRDFELIDIRDMQDFSAGHIEGARHTPLTGLLSADSLESLPAARTVVMYSNGSAHAAQAALLLQLRGRDALALLGGYNYWQAWLHDPEKAGFTEMDLQDNTPAPAEADPLGLGLGLGLGENAGKSTSEPAAPPQGETQRLLIKAEC